MNYPIKERLMRLRQSQAMRDLVQETRLSPKDLVMPLFISETIQQKQPISSMPGLFQLTLADLDTEIEELVRLKIPAVILFGIPAYKDAEGSSALRDDGIVQQAIRRIRSLNKEILIIADLCFCEYTNHGHCGVLKGQNIDVDRTIALLGEQACSLAKAGADWIAPSGMIDGMVLAVRQALDKAGFQDKAILSYAVKFSSNFYGPFREAAEGAPQFGDRKSYQMNVANGNEALREVQLDLAEGADLIIVKPALPYLDIIYRIKQRYPEIPLCGYQVSGEYAMIKAASSLHMRFEEVLLESLIAIKRAGADFIISYFAKEVAALL